MYLTQSLCQALQQPLDGFSTWLQRDPQTFSQRFEGMPASPERFAHAGLETTITSAC